MYLVDTSVLSEARRGTAEARAWLRSVDPASIALEWGRIAARRSRGMADGLIAATAIVHEKNVVTRNVADFADLDLQMINPWDR